MLVKYYVGRSTCPVLVECDGLDDFLAKVSENEQTSQAFVWVDHHGSKISHGDAVTFAAVVKMSGSTSIPSFNVTIQFNDPDTRICGPRNEIVNSEVTPKPGKYTGVGRSLGSVGCSDKENNMTPPSLGSLRTPDGDNRACGPGNGCDGAMGGAGNGRDGAMGGTDNGREAVMGGAGNDRDVAIGGVDNGRDGAIGGADNGRDGAMGGAGNGREGAMGGPGNGRDTAMGRADNGRDGAMGGAGNGRDGAMGGAGNGREGAMGGPGNGRDTAMGRADSGRDGFMGGAGNGRDGAMGGAGNGRDGAMGGAGNGRELTRDRMRQKLLDMIMAARGGHEIMEHYTNYGGLSHKAFSFIMQLISRHIVEEVTDQLAAHAKEQFAIGFVALFPTYYDHTTPDGSGAIYCRETHSGKLEWRFKNYKKSLKRTGQPNGRTPCYKKVAKVISPVAYRVANMEEERLEQDELIEQQIALQIQKHISWMKQNDGDEKRPEIVRRHTATFSYRRNRLAESDDVTAGDILEEFPRYLSIKGLISIDFALMFPEKAESLMENWTAIQRKIFALAKATFEEKKNKAMEPLLQQLHDNMEGQDENELPLKLLLCLLPPQNSGNGKKKVSVASGMKLLFDYQPVGTDVAQLLLERVDGYKGQQRSPYLLVIGTPDKFDAIFIVIDHRAIPTTLSLLVAFDELFKCHYVFGIRYEPGLNNLLTFVQTAVYRIDPMISDPPSVKDMRIKFGI